MLDQNADQSFTFAPSAGNLVDSVTVDGANVPAAASYGFINVAANHTLTVTFADAAPPAMGGGGGTALGGANGVAGCCVGGDARARAKRATETANAASRNGAARLARGR